MFVGTRAKSFDVKFRDEKIEVKCPDKSGIISVGTLGRKAISCALGSLYQDLDYIRFDYSEHFDFYDHDIIEQFQETFVNGVTKKLSKEIDDLALRYQFNLSANPLELVKPSDVFSDIDAIFLAWQDGWSLVKKSNFDKVFEYSRYSGGLVKFAIKKDGETKKSEKKKR